MTALKPTTIDDLRDMLDVTLHALDVLEALKLRKPIVVGHSLGGMIAAGLAAIATGSGIAPRILRAARPVRWRRESLRPQAGGGASSARSRGGASSACPATITPIAS